MGMNIAAVDDGFFVFVDRVHRSKKRFGVDGRGEIWFFLSFP